MADCKTCEYEKICEMPDFVRNDLKKCATYRQKKPQTNADRIRTMSDEEIAEFFCGKFMEWNKECDNDKFSDVIFTREERFLSWLKSEVKEQGKNVENSN